MSEPNGKFIRAERRSVTVTVNGQTTPDHEGNDCDNEQLPVPSSTRRPSVHDDNALRENDTDSVHHARLRAMTSFYTNILTNIGEDPSREGRDRSGVRGGRVCSGC